MLIKVILDRPGSLGLGTVDQGVALRKHPSRPRLAPGVRGWARQRPEASRYLAGGTPVVDTWVEVKQFQVLVGYGVSAGGHRAER